MQTNTSFDKIVKTKRKKESYIDFAKAHNKRKKSKELQRNRRCNKWL